VCVILIPIGDNQTMRRIAIYRDGNQIAAQIGPDWVSGIAGFGDTVVYAIRDLADSFDKHNYMLRGNSVGVDVAGKVVKIHGQPGQAPAEVIRALAWIIESRGYEEADFPEPDWTRLAQEERVMPAALN
jgi:hypothetical protein